MKYRKLGNTDIDVSVICLGTMTWGQQNTPLDAFEQLDYALDQGINFIDTAEMYPVPPKAETVFRTEEYLGKWLKERGRRDDVVLATKVTGRGDHNPGTKHIRGGARLNRQHIREAVDGSLERLNTDYIDLYQLHWPERATNFFGRLGYESADVGDEVPLAETLAVLDELVREGKVRHIGLSNETPWGLMECLRRADAAGRPRVQSIQNPYNLLNRSFEIGLAEMALNEQVGLLAYSPLGCGVLSGKYLDGAKPANSRLTLFERFTRYSGDRSQEATARYVALAREHDLDPAQMALAYVNSRPFVTSNIIGATTMAQLRANVASIDMELSDEVMSAIEAIHRDNPNPAP